MAKLIEVEVIAYFQTPPEKQLLNPDKVVRVKAGETGEAVTMDYCTITLDDGSELLAKGTLAEVKAQIEG